MATKTTDERLAEMRRRIDELDTRAQAAGAHAKESFEAQVGVLRDREASARAAVREAHDAKVAEISEHAHAAEDKLEQLDTRVKEAEHALAAELAEDKQAFIKAMEADLADFKESFSQLEAKAGSARERAQSEIGTARAKLEQKLDAVTKKFE